MPAFALAACVALFTVGEAFPPPLAGEIPRDATLGDLAFAPPTLAWMNPLSALLVPAHGTLWLRKRAV